MQLNGYYQNLKSRAFRASLQNYMSETQAYKNHINGYAQGSTPAGDGFMNIPDGIDEELPFN